MQKNNLHSKEKNSKCRQGNFSPETLAASYHRWRSVLASTPITLTIQVFSLSRSRSSWSSRWWSSPLSRASHRQGHGHHGRHFQGHDHPHHDGDDFPRKYINKLQHILRGKIRRKLIISCRAHCSSVVGTCWPRARWCPCCTGWLLISYQISILSMCDQ